MSLRCRPLRKLPTRRLHGGTGAAAGLVETITPAKLGSRKTWRIVHYPQDPTVTQTNEYDLYDLDQVTLAPLRSVMNTAEYRLVYDDNGLSQAPKKRTGASARETLSRAPAVGVYLDP